MNRLLSGIFMIIVLFSGCIQEKSETKTEQWSIFELILKGPASGNPYMEADLNAVFSNGVESITVPGFYDGNGSI